NSMVSSKVNAWRCEVCGYVHLGPEQPAECPVCGAPASDFSPVDPPVAPAAAVASAGGTVGRLVGIGGGIAGVSAAAAARLAAPDTEVTLIAAERAPPYYRLNITRLLAGEIEADALPLHPAEWYAQQRIRLLSGATVRALRLDRRAVELASGDVIPFDRLILTTGADAVLPPWPGNARAGVLVLRTLTDVRQALALLRPGLRCVCIGGGILGLEAAGALARRGAQVALLANSGWLMPRQLTRAGGEVLARHVRGLGIRLHPAVQVREITGAGRATGVTLADGATLPAELVLVTAGIRPRTALAAAAGLDVRQGVVVDDYLTTSHPDVCAAGDAAEHRGVVYGLWPAAQYQGQLAGRNAAGQHAAFGGLPRVNVLKVLGLHVFSIGTAAVPAAGARVLEQATADQYLHFVFQDRRLAGAIVIGRDGLDAALKKIVETGQDLSAELAGAPTADAFAAALVGRPEKD
ncbi:MAG: FAD-dependent oxidoreductase, partial [Kiritimatiellaeota bacterium]|nr:FAD-dependent oxidoreductase [Kiritimatiellota bacterium]